MDDVRCPEIDALHAPWRGQQAILGRHHPALRSKEDELLRDQRTSHTQGQCPSSLIHNNNHYYIIIMIARLIPLFRFATKALVKRNSIDPSTGFVAYGHYFPKGWDEKEIYAQIDPSRKNIEQIHVVKNRVGQATGKVMFKFYTAEAMRNYMEKYNEDFIVTKEEAHRVILQPFELKTSLARSQVNERRTKNAVRVKNMDFQITAQELERVAKDYGTVEFVEMNVRSNGLNNGMATVYFKKLKEAQDFSYFCHGLILRERKLSAEVINTRNISSEIEYLQQPKLILQANLQLYKRMVAKQAEAKNEQQSK